MPRSTTVVGVDGSDTSIAALRWACAEASMTGARIDALIAWQWPTGFGKAVPIVSGYDPEADARSLLEQMVGSVSVDFPGVEVHSKTFQGHPGEVLVEASRHADLLVVGCRGLGELSGMLLGSVSQYCATHAATPVVVFRPAST